MKNLLLKLKLVSKSAIILISFFAISFSSQMNAQDCDTPIGAYPWTDDFESGLSVCYQQTPIVGTNEWVLHQGGYQAQSGNLGYPKNANSGLWNLWFFSETMGATTRIVLPKFDLDGGENTFLTFWHAQYPWSGAQDVLNVYYKNSIIGEWILLKSYTDPIEEWTKDTLLLRNPTATYWIAFEGIANYGRGIVVDDITVNCTGCMTGCERPDNVSRLMHNPNYFDVKLIWEAPDTTGYDIQIVGYNVYQNDGSLLTTEPITDMFYQLNDLDPIGSYSYGVTVVYSDGCESEKAPINFTLNNPAEINMPVSGTVTYTTCSGTVYDDGGAAGEYSNGCNGIMIIQPDQSGYGATIQGTYNTESGNDKLYVYEGSGINGTLLETYSGANGTIPLTSSTLGPITLHFTSNASVVRSGFTIHVSCTEIEDCLPPFDLTADVESAELINVTWTPSGEGDVSWNLEYGLSGFTPGIGAGTLVSEIATTAYTITGTNPVTSYDIYVQTNCSDGDTSVWGAPCSFTTPCSIFNPPFSEGFENETFPPSCWTTVHTAGTGTSLWTRNTSATYIHSGSGSAKLPDQQVGNITDLVTGQLNIPTADAYQITFWMYRSNYSSIKYNEGVKVWVNATPDTVNGTVLLHIPRQYTVEPIVPEVGWYEYNVTIPTSGVMYVIFQGISEYGSASYIDDIMVDALPACPKPTLVTAYAPTESSIALSWTAGANETSWNLEYGPVGFDLGTGTFVENITNPYTLTGLSTSTEYSVYVQANCADGGTSNWSAACNFATSCGAVTIPFTENFDNYGTGTGTSPNCWVIGGTYSTLPYCYGTYSHSSPASFRLYASSTTYTYAATPMMGVPHVSTLQVGFWGYSTSVSNTIQVGIMTDPTDISTFTLLETYSVATTSTWEYFELPLGSYEGAGHYVAFKSERSAANTFYIDDVVISAMPNCPRPSGLGLALITSNSADISWDENGSATSWDLEFGASDFTLGTGTRFSNITVNPFTINGLDPVTTYDCYVRSICSVGDTSDWSICFSFTTPCSEYSVPFMESFSSTTFPPNTCWQKMTGLASNAFSGTNPTSTSSGWTRVTTNNGIEGPHPKVNIYGSSCKYWLVTPVLDLGTSTDNVLMFDVAFTDYGNGNVPEQVGEDDKFMVIVSTDGGSTWLESNATIWDYAGTNYTLSSIPNSAQSVVIPLSAYSGMIQIAFYGESTTSGGDNDLHIGNIYVGSSDICYLPNDFTASNPTETSIDLSWTIGNNETAWNLEYGLSGYSVGNGTVVSGVTTTSYTLSGLSSSTVYDVYVQSVCGEGDVSAWRGPLTFNTSCGVVSVPFSENFDSYGTGSTARPLCWTFGGTYTTMPYCYASYNHSEPASLRLYSSSTTYVYAVSPQINVDMINTLQVDLWGYSTSTANTLEIGVMADPLNFETFESVGTIQVTTSSTWEYFEVLLNNYQGTGKYVAFKGERSAANTFYIDDLMVETIPTCPRPTDLAVAGTTDNSVSLTWTENGTATAWNVEYGATGFTQGTGVTVPATSTAFTLNNLVALVTYDIYVQSNCGENDLSLWVGPVTFTCGVSEYEMPSTGTITVTTCGANIYDDGGADGNYTNNSDGTMIIEPSTAGAMVQVEGTYIIETSWDHLYIYDGSGTEGALLGSYSNSSGGTIPLTTSTEGSLTLHFTSDGSVNKTGFELLVTCEGGGTCPRPTNFVASSILPRSVVLDWTSGTTETSWEIEYGLSGFIPGTGAGTVATTTTHPYTVSNLNPETTYDFYVRSLCGTTEMSDWKSLLGITTLISCPAPSALSILSVTPSSATITWTENGAATAWNVEYGSVGFVQGTGTMLTNVSNPYTINGLTAGTAYQFYVQAACGEGDLSIWVGPKNFTPGSGVNECVVIGEGTSGTYTLPLNTFYKHSYSQQIITSDELMDLGVLPGSSINSIAFQYFYGTAQTKDPVTIYLGEVERTAFASTSDWESASNMEQVFTGSIEFANTGEDFWVEVEFDNAFVWGGDNLLVAVLNNNGAYTTSSNQTFYKHTATDNISLRYQVDGTTPINLETFSSTGTRSSDRSNIRLCVTSGGSSTCRTPNALAATDITANIVTLTWVPRGTETSWEIEYGTTGFIQGTGTIVPAGYYPFNITGLEPFTTYDFYVRAVCGENDYSTWKALMNVTTLESCLRPTELSLAGITETTATVAWTENGGATSWNIEYGLEGFTLGTGISLNHVTSNPYTIIGLESEVRYDCYVQTICSADNMSIWVGPISFSVGSQDCAVIGEGTTGVNYLPVNTFYNYSYTQQIYTAAELAAIGISSGELNALSFQYFYDTPQTKDNVTVYLCNTTKTSFSGGDWEPVSNMQAVFTGSVYFENTGDDYWVEIPFDNNFVWNGSDNLLVAVLNNHGDYTTSSNSTFYTHTTTEDLSLRYQNDGSSINPESLTYSGTSGTNRNNIKLCFVQSEPPSCMRPSNVTVTNATATQAQITWSSSALSWNIELGLRGFTPTMTPTNSGVSNPCVLSNLTPNTEYAFYVQSNCTGNQVSEWIGPYYFSTACDVVLDIPFFEGFEEGEKPECWLNMQMEGSMTWNYQSGCFESTPETAFEGNYNALLYSEGNRNVTRLVTPTINLSGLTEAPILSFAYAQPEWGFSQDKLSIWVKNTQDGNWSKLIDYNENVTEWRSESLILPNPTSTYWIAFEVDGDWGHGVAVDAVSVLQDAVAPIVGSNAVCAHAEEVYSTTEGMTGYEWEVFGGEITSGAGTNEITVLWGESGTGMVNVKYDGMTYNNNLYITISDSPLAAVYASEDHICQGQSTTLTVVGEGSYLWSTGATTATIVVSPAVTTTYTVSVFENAQCATELEIEIIVDEFNDIDIIGDNDICAGESTVLTAIGGTAFLWSTGETTASIEVQPLMNTHYSVIISNEIGCTNMDSIVVLVTNVQTPANVVAEPLDGHISVTWDAMSNVAKYYVYRDEVKYDSTATNYFGDYNIDFNTEYCYSVSIMRNNCESALSDFDCALVSGIEEIENGIQIYPNPASTRVFIQGDNMHQVTVFNILGQQVEMQTEIQDSTLTINTAEFESGIYLLRIETKDGKVISRRVVIAH